MLPSLPSSQSPQQVGLLSRFFPRTIHNRRKYSKEYLLTKLMASWLVFRGYRMIFNNQWTKWNDRSFKWFFKSPFERCFPFRQAILNVSQSAVAFHGIRPPIFIRTCLQQYSRSPFFNFASCSLSNPIERWGSTYNDSTRDLHRLFQTSRNCVCEWLFGS